MADKLDRFSKRARRVLTVAQEEALRLKEANGGEVVVLSSTRRRVLLRRCAAGPADQGRGSKGDPARRPRRGADRGRADDARLPDQQDLRGVERDHASVHGPRGGRQAPRGRGLDHRPEEEPRREGPGAAQDRRLLRLLTGSQGGRGRRADRSR